MKNFFKGKKLSNEMENHMKLKGNKTIKKNCHIYDFFFCKCTKTKGNKFEIKRSL